MSRFLIATSLCLLLTFPTLSHAKSLTFMGLGNEHDAYYNALLTEILNATDKGMYQVNQYDKTLPHHRAFYLLAKQQEIDIVVGYATKEREQRHLSVAIPLMKGLNGWRLSVVHQDNIDQFKNVKSLAAFKKFIPGQYHASGDFKILIANDFKPAQGSNFNGMYYMLHKKRIEYFPRSIAEIEREVAIFSGEDHKLNIAIEPHVLLIYPTAFYFYVNEQNSALAAKIKEGFELLIANGQFDHIFNLHYGELIEKIKNENRQVFRLDNPFLPSNVPLERKELWL